ncbi:MAG: T9SS type A sorting domain-containing protein [Bacteroidetes bacterium]|nr:T9SS type A sorting domain-containing protein [Bacteroidota bacterium]
MKCKIDIVLRFFILVIIAVFGCRNISFAQQIEEVSLDSFFHGSVNTYLTDINNSGFVSGYYDSAGITNGFVINPNGKLIRIVGATGNNIKVMGINENNVVCIDLTNVNGTTIYKAYYDSVNEKYTSPVAVPNIQQPNSLPQDINNNNDIVGYYQGANSKWLFVDHDSVTPPAPCAQWDANRYMVGPTYYNTYAGGINNNNMVAGFYISGNQYGPFIYNNLDQTYLILNTAFSMKLWGINDDSVVCGEYKTGNGTYVAFWGPVLPTGIVQVHSLSSIFQSNTIQSVAMGINNKGEIVGYYLHPVSNVWVGFIYRPNINEYRLPGYSFSQHSWSMKNNTNATNGVWTGNYYNTINYNTSDPYYPAINSPLFDAYILALYPNLAITNSWCTDWAAFAAEVDTTGYLNNPTWLNQQAYKLLWRHFAFSRWRSRSAYLGSSFPGICYGFAFTSLMKYTNDSVLHDWFGLPYNANIHGMDHNNGTAIRAIERTYLKQYDADIRQYMPNRRYDLGMWNGLYRLKNTYMDTSASRRNPRAVYLKFTNGWHSVMPYKIKTPQTLPFYYNNVYQYDSLFVYDSNYPDDTTQYFICLANSMYNWTGNAGSGTYGNFKELCLNEASVKEMTTMIKHSQLKSTAAGVDPYLQMAAGPDNYYVFSDATGQAVHNATQDTNSTTVLTSIESKSENINYPDFYFMDTSAAAKVDLTSYNYTGGSMMWTQSNDHRAMGITRAATASETDFSTIKNHFMSYGTHDNAGKSLNCYLEEMSQNYQQGVNILAHNLGVVQGDSILTENPSQFVYKITKLTAGNTTYDLWVYTMGADSVRQFINDGITLSGNTSHTIVPYYDGPNGTQTVVYVDQGNDGVYEDTLFLTYVPVGLDEVQKNADFIKTYPNPVQKQLSIAINRPQQGSYAVSLLDVLGRIVYKQQMNFKAGNDVQQIPVSNLAQGAYFIRISDDKGKNIYMEKILKQ